MNRATPFRAFASGALSSIAALVLAACSPQSAGDGLGAPVTNGQGVHPVSGLEVVPLRVTTQDGSHAFRVEVAASDAQQQRGLMFRTQLGENEGMLFPSDGPQMRSFWMRNTVIPLDIIFIGPDRTIINIAANTVPYSETPVPSAAPAIAVLELNGGRAAELGIAPGDTVAW